MPVIDVEVSDCLLKFVVSDRSTAYWPLSGTTSEPETLQWVETFRPGEVFYDIGANIGLYSLYAAASRCVCVAFEPNPFSFDTLVRNIVANGLENTIIPFGFALGGDVRISRLGIATPEAGSVGSTLAEGNDGRLQVGTLIALLDRMVTIDGMPFPKALFANRIDVHPPMAAARQWRGVGSG